MQTEEEIFDKLAPFIFGYLKTMLRNEHTAEDVLQNTFIKVFAAIKKNYEIQNLRAFTITIARNEAIREINRLHNQVSLLSEPIFKVKDSSCINLEEALSIEEALLSLPEEQREVVYLKIYGNLSFEEISEFTQIPLNTAASRYRYALEKLKKVLNV